MSHIGRLQVLNRTPIFSSLYSARPLFLSRLLYYSTASSPTKLSQYNQRISRSTRLRRSNINLALPKRGPSFKQEEFASPDELSFEPPLKIVKYPDPLLRAKNKPINVYGDDLKKLVDEMFDIMYKTDGIGLSAPQVGINVQLMVFNPAGERGEGEEIVLINPRVNKYSQKTTLYNEGCLSFPGIYADVERPVSVRVDARDVTGVRFSINFSGLPARVFQHEFDHLEGILFFERMTEQVLDGIRPNLQALEKIYEDTTGLPSPERVEGSRKKKAGVGFGR